MENNKGNTNSSHYLKRKEEDIPIASYDVLYQMSIKELEKYIDNLMKHENRTKTLDGKNLKLARKRATKVFLKKKLDYAIAARKSMDDESIRGMFLNTNYFMISEYVAIQVYTKDEHIWIVNNDSFMRKYIKDNNQNMIQKDIELKICFEGDRDYDVAEEIARDVVIACKRSVKKSDILIIAMKSYLRCDGIVFGERSLYIMNDKKVDYIITYDEIERADYENNLLRIVRKGDKKIDIEMTDRDYAMEMFNLLTDIKERGE